MGCTESKLDNEDTVRRCKERRRLMKEAVYSRHQLAAAHSDYCHSLRITGSALVTFASGEPFSVSDHTPAVLLRTPTSTTAESKIPTSTTAESKIPTFTPRTHRHNSPSPSPSVHPPPPRRPMSTTSSHFSHKPPPPPPRRRRKHIKLPHILSDSSLTSSPPPNHNFTYNARANSTYSTTPSQTSSVWDWENLYPPPSPPDSEFFAQIHKSKKNEINDNSDDDHRYIDNGNDDKTSNYTSFSKVSSQDHQNHNPTNKNEAKQFDDDRASNYSSYSQNSNYTQTKNHIKKPPEPVQTKRSNFKSWESEEDETEREEVQYSEWGDHDNYSSTSSSSDEEEGDVKSRSDFGTKSSYESMKNESVSDLGNAKAKSNFKFSSISEDDEKSSENRNLEDANYDRRIVVRHRDLAEIVAALKEYFDKAASAGDQVTEMLEAGRDQLDRSFKQLRKTIYHSSGMLSSLSSSWTSKPPLTVKYRFEPNSLEQSGGPKSLCSTLERLLAWEKKLYQEVKGREGVKIEHERKLSALQSQEYRGEEDAKLNKTKASIKRLQSLIVVTSQAVSTTSSAIIGLRDSDLIPELVDLCHGFMYMWRLMNQFHQFQNDIVQQVRGLVNHATRFESTSDLHRRATADLISAVSSWHTSFCHLIKFQRDFIRSLHGWFKLTLVPVNTESTNDNVELLEVFAFFDEWKLAVERVPDTVAFEAIKSFDNVVRSISLKQTEELKIKKRTEAASKELDKKASSIRNLEKKYYHSYSMVGIGPPDVVPDNGHVLDARDPLAEKKAEVGVWQRRVEDEMIKHSKAVEVTRAMTLNNIQTGLPGVFQAMTSFSAMITEALETVCTRSYDI